MAAPPPDPGLIDQLLRLALAFLTLISGWLAKALHTTHQEKKRLEQRQVSEEGIEPEDINTAMQQHAAIHRHIGVVRKQQEQAEARLREDIARIGEKADDDYARVSNDLAEHLKEVAKSMERLLRAELQMEQVMRDQNSFRAEQREQFQQFMGALEKVRSTIDDLKEAAYKAYRQPVGDSERRG